MPKERLAVLSICIFLFSGCAGAPVYKSVFKEKGGYNQREFSDSKEKLYLATMKTICSKNFIIEKESEGKDFILAKRSFQKGKKTTVLVLQAKIVSDSDNASTLYLNALQIAERSYVADRTRFFLFIIPLPGGGGKEATQVKEEEKAIEDEEFYRNFFAEVEQQCLRKSAREEKRNVMTLEASENTENN